MNYAASAKVRLHAATPQPNHAGTRLKSWRFHSRRADLKK
jgi:hypothetical protein